MSTQIFDLKLALERAANKPDLVRELMLMLVDDLSQQKQLLAQAWQSGDHLALRNVVHKIHGGTRYCGVPGLQSSSEQLEIALDNHSTSLEPLYQELMGQIDSLLQADVEQLLRTET